MVLVVGDRAVLVLGVGWCWWLGQGGIGVRSRVVLVLEVEWSW